jgi:ribosome-associated protein
VFFMLEITSTFSIDERELQFDYIRASGPGGQNVNKVATAVQLRFDITNSPSLASDIKGRLIRLAGNRVNADGVLLIEAKRFRTQEQNREDATERLIELLRKASIKPKKRLKTKPTRASKEERLKEKKQRGAIKKTRQTKSFD